MLLEADKSIGSSPSLLTRSSSAPLSTKYRAMLTKLEGIPVRWLNKEEVRYCDSLLPAGGCGVQGSPSLIVCTVNVRTLFY